MSESFQVYDVPRRCKCGAEWLGKSFIPAGEGETMPRGGMCDPCAVAADAKLRELTRPIARERPADVDLTPPRRVREWGD